MKSIQNSSNQKASAKVAPVSCHCKLSLLVVHLQYLNERQKNQSLNKRAPTLGDDRKLFYQYI
ncbi:hypothetical protein AHMF7605_24235 [Adhaeribacter arboris]|uniref:Uncharacterized protein n=1 Tax=Adhaeribacter arboris TaxID=2072846 RepID=A0A2T2YLI9_9BACT|nr:hypothetical protein [Adhaeribacter arboris]PSR56383.1 hypothetical protein AHMF7605_24235 [Adhaeribacter arboris]